MFPRNGISYADDGDNDGNPVTVDALVDVEALVIDPVRWYNPPEDIIDDPLYWL